uniref:KIB1-4 beta-propeller domain-containing protein n=3 Tax=Chenopodium quinoa TaxID=63459 RepID=A0A803M2W0_CHEQI
AFRCEIRSVEGLFEFIIGPQIHHNQRLEWTKAMEGEDDQQNDNSKHIGLPVDVIEFIISSFVKRFSMRYAIRLSAVCKHWLDIVSLETPDEPPWITVESFLDCDYKLWLDIVNSETFDESPWITAKSFLDSDKENKYITCLNLWGNEDSMDQATYRLPGFSMAMTPASERSSIILASSQGGWLIFGCYCHRYPRKVSPRVDEPLSLYNPFLNIYFDLLMYSPPRSTCCRHIEGIKAFSVFSYNLYPGNYFVVISRICNLSLCRLDGQGKWFYYHNKRHLPYCDLLFHREEQCLYASDQRGVDIFTVECDYESDCGSSQAFRLTAVSFVQITFNVLDDKLVSTHLVKLCGYIIVVTKASDKAGSRKDPDWTVEVYKFGNKDKCLSRVSSIGEHALFLADAGSASFCVSARYFPKVQQNCIYFHHYFLGCITTVSLEDGAINRTCYRYMGLLPSNLSAAASRFISPPYLNSRQFFSIK